MKTIPMNNGPVAASRQSAANFTPTRWRRSTETPLRQQPRAHGATALARMLLTLATAWLLATGAALAQSSTTSISFQGALNGAGGTPLPNGSYTLTFRFYTNAVGGVALGTTNVTGVAMANGIASTAIPVQPAWFDGNTRYLGISVSGGAELAPRVLVTAVPYAISASALNGVASLDNGHLVLNPEDAVAEGGAIKLRGAGSYPDWFTDVFHDEYRIFHAASGAVPFTIDTNNVTCIGYLSMAPIDFGNGIGGKIRLEGSQGNPTWWLDSYHEELRLYNSSSGIVPFVINSQNGYVGIGGRPSATLDVNGTARMTVCQITSDRNAKTGYQPVDSRSVLEKLLALPLTTWAYTNNPGIRHLGPVAQDFAAAFALGEDDQHIATVDADGVLFASVQALHQLVQEKDARITALERELAATKADLSARLTALEKGTPASATSGSPALSVHHHP